MTIPADEDGPFVFEISLPEDLPAGAVVDLIVRPERAAAFPDSLAARSVRLLAIEPMTAAGGA